MTSAGARWNGHVIRTQALTKRYGDLRAVDGVNLEVRTATSYGFLGANGSGKTTTVRMLLGWCCPPPGRLKCWVCRCQAPPQRACRESVHSWRVRRLSAPLRQSEPRSARCHRIRPQSDDRTPHPHCHCARTRRDSDPADRRPSAPTHKGCVSDSGLAAALMRRPKLLILDEPTNGLDPQGIQEIRRLLLQLNDDGTTIFLPAICSPRSSRCVLASGCYGWAADRPRAAGHPAATDWSGSGADA
jgi:ABC-2 type transport system ATP-binding protein